MSIFLKSRMRSSFITVTLEAKNVRSGGEAFVVYREIGIFSPHSDINRA